MFYGNELREDSLKCILYSTADGLLCMGWNEMRVSKFSVLGELS